MRIYKTIEQHLRWIRIVLIACATQVVILEAMAKPVVIGYIPAFREFTATIDSTDLRLVTHVNISYLNPDATGTLIEDDTMPYMPDSTGTGTSALSQEAAGSGQRAAGSGQRAAGSGQRAAGSGQPIKNH